MITPKPLFKGARVALVCASSAVPAERLAPAEAAAHIKAALAANDGPVILEK